MGGRACVARGDVLLRQRGQILAQPGAREPSCHCRPTTPAHAVALEPRAPSAPAGLWGFKGGQQRAPGGQVNPRRFGVPGKSGDATPNPLDEGVQTGRPARTGLWALGWARPWPQLCALTLAGVSAAGLTLSSACPAALACPAVAWACLEDGESSAAEGPNTAKAARQGESSQTASSGAVCQVPCGRGHLRHPCCANKRSPPKSSS